MVCPQMPDNDLVNRRLGQKVDPMTGEMYTKEVYDPDKPEPVVSMCVQVSDVWSSWMIADELLLIITAILNLVQVCSLYSTPVHSTV